MMEREKRPAGPATKFRRKLKRAEARLPIRNASGEKETAHVRTKIRCVYGDCPQEVGYSILRHFRGTRKTTSQTEPPEIREGAVILGPDGGLCRNHNTKENIELYTEPLKGPYQESKE